MDRFPFSPFPPHCSSFSLFFFSFSGFILKYKKKKLQSNFLFKAFSLAEIQYKKIFSAVNLLGVITNNAPRVHFFTVLGYMCLSFTSVNLSHRNLPYRTTSGFPCVVKKTSLLYIQTPPAFGGGEHGISIYEQLELSSAKSAWVRGFPRTFKGFSFSLFILFYFTIKSFCPPAPRGLISTSLRFSGKVFHLVLSFQHLFFHCCGHSPSQGSESR